MGEVYLAQDTSELGRTVALKILPAEVAKDKDRLQRFIQEARTVSNLNHPNILTVHEFGQTESTSFMATEYVDGVTLRQHLSSRRLKLVDLLDVAIQIVAALNAAHEAGVTLRDLKPEMAIIYFALGDKEKAFLNLEKAFEGKEDHLLHLTTEPMFDSLHSDPRFKDLVRRIGLPE